MQYRQETAQKHSRKTMAGGTAKTGLSKLYPWHRSSICQSMDQFMSATCRAESKEYRELFECPTCEVPFI